MSFLEDKRPLSFCETKDNTDSKNNGTAPEEPLVPEWKSRCFEVKNTIVDDERYKEKVSTNIRCGDTRKEWMVIGSKKNSCLFS